LQHDNIKVINLKISTMTIYVGNLSYQAGEQELTQLFSEFGEVKSVKLISDKFTGRSKGFAFVEMAEESAASQAIEALDKKEFMTRTLTVNEAKPRTEGDRPARSGGFNRGGGGDRRGGGNRDRGDRGGYGGGY
jgi:RNA recognition motif-containing protein